MPNELTRSIFKCVHCGEEFEDREKAEYHEEHAHDILWLPFERTDLSRLVNYISMTEDKNNMLTKRLLDTLFKYFRS